MELKKIVENKKNSILKNYIYNAGSEIISLLVPLLLVPYTSRTLGVDNIGIYSYINSIVIVFSSIGKIGINTYGKLKIAQNRDFKEELSNIISNLVFLRFFLSLIVLGVYEQCIGRITEFKVIGIIFGIYILSDAFDISWIYQGLENFKTIAIRKFFSKLLNLVLVLLFVRNETDLIAYTAIIQLTLLIMNMSLWIGVRKYISLKVLSIKTIKSAIIPCLIYFIPTVANLIYNTLDKVMLGYITKSTYESGCYEQAYKIINITQTFILMIGNTTLPRLTYLYKKKNIQEFVSIVQKSFKVIWMFTLPMACGILINAELIVRITFGDDYNGSITILRILSLMLIFATLNYNIGNQILISTEKQREYNISVVLSAVINFCMNIILIGKFSAKGAAIGSLIAEILVFGLFIFFASRLVSLQTIFHKSIYKYLIATLIMSGVNIGCIRVLHKLSIFVLFGIILVISSLTYFIVLHILGENIYH